MGNTYLSEAEITAITKTVKAMSQEEQAVVLSAIDNTELLWNEVGFRLFEASEFKKSVFDMVLNR